MPKSSRSIKVDPKCLPRVKQSLRRHGFPSQKALAYEMGLSYSTVSNFFTGRGIDYTNFVEISERLGLDWHAIAYIEEEPPITTQVISEPPEPLPNNSLGIDWRQVSQDMLQVHNQQRLTTNPLTAGDGLTFELDEIYVPLGLVERKQRERRVGDVSPEQGSSVYEPEATDEIVQKFQNNEFFEQVLRPGRSTRIAIIGEPGAGKTTLLQKIAAWVLDHTSEVPIWISLADLQGKTLEEYLLTDWLKAATRKVRVTQEMEEALGELFNSRKVWLLLDAVDEMVADSGNALAQIAKQITGWVSDARVVLTCRLNVWDGGKNALEAFDTYRNLDFSYGDAQSPDQVGQFIRCWFKDNPANAERLRSDLDKSGRERIKDAVKNPLRLALLCRTWTLGQGELPHTKAGLYQQFTEALYEWKQDQFPTSSTQRQELNKALGELALRAISEEKTKFRLRHRLVRKILGEPDTDLFKLALQLGWLNQVGVAAEAENRGEKVYAFYHPSFQEYFAAQAINDWHYFLNHIPDHPTQGIYRIFEPQWKEVILLWLGREDVPNEQKEELIAALAEFEDGCEGFYEYRAYFLAAAGIPEFRDCSKADEIVTQIVECGFGYFNIDKQEWMTFYKPIEDGARATLSETDRGRAIAALVPLISPNKERFTHRRVAQSLGEIGTGNQTAIMALMELLKSTKNESTQRIAAENLGKIDPGNQTAITTLVQLIQSTEDEFTRLQAVESLGKIDPGNKEMIVTLIQLIKSNQYEYIRRAAVESLEEITYGNQEIIAALVQLLEPTEDEFTRRLALESLEKVGMSHPTAIAALVKLSSSTQDESTRELAAETLGKIDTSNKDAVTALNQLLSSTQDEDIRRRAAESLGKIDSGNETAISALVQVILSTKDESIRKRATYSLGEIGISHPTAIAALLRVISSTEDKSTRSLAAYNLGKIAPGNEIAISALVQLLDSTQDESIRWQAAENLGKIDSGNEIAISALVQLLESTEDKFIRWQAAESLGEIGTGNDTAISTLIKLIESSEYEDTHRQAAESLKEILRDKQFAQTVSALKDYSSDERYEKDFDRFDECYKLIWHCAQNMTYPDFYQAWHHSTASV